MSCEPQSSLKSDGPRHRPVECSRLRHPGLDVIDRMARLELAMRRRGCELRMANAGEGFLELLAFAGLAEVSRVEPGGQSEH